MEKQNVLSNNSKKIYLYEVKKILARDKKYFDMVHKKLAGIPDDFGETLRHSQRMANLCYLLAKHLGWSDERTNSFVEAGVTHDVGKIILPKEVLHPEDFGPEELSIVKRHPRAGYLLILSWKRGMRVANPVLLHHKHQGRRSYPQLTDFERSQISDEDKLQGRLLAMVDVFDTFVFGRKKTKIFPIPLPEAMRLLRKQFHKPGEEEIIEFLFAQYQKIKKIADAACPL